MSSPGSCSQSRSARADFPTAVGPARTKTLGGGLIHRRSRRRTSDSVARRFAPERRLACGSRWGRAPSGRRAFNLVHLRGGAGGPRCERRELGPSVATKAFINCPVRQLRSTNADAGGVPAPVCHSAGARDDARERHWSVCSPPAGRTCSARRAAAFSHSACPTCSRTMPERSPSCAPMMRGSPARR